ncbi:MAG: GPW/gp25 family protein [Desulfobacteraceae bacterium]|nr:GPW/gp25 family protein [Desulfobacteraceae bacterium]
MTRFLGTGLGFPVEKDEDTCRLTLAAYEESIKQGIWIVLSTARGERVMRPDFGCDIHELVFAPNDAATRGLAQHHVSEALRVWEPRIEVLDVKVRSGGVQGETLHIGIEYRVRTTDNRFNLVYPFYLQRGLP